MTKIVSPLTTGIGSLPHHNIDSALNFAFQMDIPFLPQIPIRNPWEFMVAQALEGLPGLEVEKSGNVFLDVNVWTGRHYALSDRLSAAYSSSISQNAYESFEPSQATSSSWQPFLWELEERQLFTAKIQITGPITCQWAIQFRNESKRPQGISSQIFQLVLARALAMSRKLKSMEINPVLFIDEPALYSLISTDPMHQLKLQELKLMIQTLRKEGVQVGLHCCSNTDWNSVLALGLDLLSIDIELSLLPLLKNQDSLNSYIQSGGRLSLGVIPTAHAFDSKSFSAQSLLHRIFEIFGNAGMKDVDQVRKILRESLFTPACGLALHRVEDSEDILHALTEFKSYVSSVTH